MRDSFLDFFLSFFFFFFFRGFFVVVVVEVVGFLRFLPTASSKSESEEELEEESSSLIVTFLVCFLCVCCGRLDKELKHTSVCVSKREESCTMLFILLPMNSSLAKYIKERKRERLIYVRDYNLSKVR